MVLIPSSILPISMEVSPTAQHSGAGESTMKTISVPSCVLASSLLVAGTAFGQPSPPSEWVFYGPDGRLQYQALPNGDQIMDFSYAGYMGGGVGLPNVPARQTVNPSGGDDTAAIQAAINAVSALPPDENGFRGAVLLVPGTFNCSAALNISTSGVVLRGSGSGANGTIINATGDPHTSFRL